MKHQSEAAVLPPALEAVALACEAGVKALDGGIVPVETAERPAFYA